jgi:type VI secretion system protein ImpM
MKLGDLLARRQSPAPPPVQVVAGLFGKLPSQGDFVRVNAAPVLTGGLDRWLEDNLSALHGAGVDLPAVPLRLFTPLGRGALMGSLLPSRDKVGRAFPLLVFLVVPEEAVDNYPVALPAYGAWFAQAEAVAMGLCRGEEPDPAAALAGLGPPPQFDPAACHAIERDALGRSVDDFARRLFSPDAGDSGSFAYALACLEAACGRVAGAFPARGGVDLDVPVPDIASLVLWLCLIRRQVAWPTGAPTYLWNMAEGRALVTLGPPSARSLLAIAGPDRLGDRLWRLDGASSESVSTGASRLKPTVAQALADPGSAASALVSAYA